MTQFRTNKNKKVYPLNQSKSSSSSDYKKPKSIHQLKKEIRKMNAPVIIKSVRTDGTALLYISYKDREEVYERVQNSSYKEITEGQDGNPYTQYDSIELAKGGGGREIHLNSLLEDWHGKSRGKTKKDFDREQLEDGTIVELEHTTDLDLAERIAMDHLTEDKDYYIKLKKIHKEG